MGRIWENVARSSNKTGANIKKKYEKYKKVAESLEEFIDMYLWISINKEYQKAIFFCSDGEYCDNNV